MALNSPAVKVNKRTVFLWLLAKACRVPAVFGGAAAVVKFHVSAEFVGLTILLKVVRFVAEFPLTNTK